MTANLELKSGFGGPPSPFGAGAYASDGLFTVTEYLGRPLLPDWRACWQGALPCLGPP